MLILIFQEAIDRLTTIKQKDNQLEQFQLENTRLRNYEENFENIQVFTIISILLMFLIILIYHFGFFISNIYLFFCSFCVETYFCFVFFLYFLSHFVDVCDKLFIAFSLFRTERIILSFCCIFICFSMYHCKYFNYALSSNICTLCQK